MKKVRSVAISFGASPSELFPSHPTSKQSSPSAPSMPFSATITKIDNGWLVRLPGPSDDVFSSREKAFTTFEACSAAVKQCYEEKSGKASQTGPGEQFHEGEVEDEIEEGEDDED